MMNIKHIVISSLTAGSLLTIGCKAQQKSSVKEGVDYEQRAKDATCDIGNAWWIVLMTGISPGGHGAAKFPAEIAMGAAFSLGNGALQRSSLCTGPTNTFGAEDTAKVLNSTIDKDFIKAQARIIEGVSTNLTELNRYENGDSRQFLSRNAEDAFKAAQLFDRQGLNYLGQWAAAMSLRLAFLKEKLLMAKKSGAPKETIASDAQAIVDVVDGIPGKTSSLQEKIARMRSESYIAASKFFEEKNYQKLDPYNERELATYKLCRRPLGFSADDKAYMQAFNDPKVIPKTLQKRAKLLEKGDICSENEVDVDDEVALKIQELDADIQFDLIDNDAKVIKLGDAAERLKSDYGALAVK